MNKRRIFLTAVALGVVLGAGIALTRAGRSEKGGERPTSNVQCPTSNVVAVVDKGQKTEAKGVVTNAVKVAVATNVAVNVQLPKLPNPQTPKPPKPITTYAPNVPKARQVLLANRRIVVEKGRSFPKKFCQAQTPTARGTAPYIVISEIPVSRDVRIQAVADGAKVIGFLPNNALLVEADAAALKNLEDDAMFLAAVEYEPTDKIQQAVRGEIGERGESGEKKIEATVVLLNETDRETVSAFVTANGGKMIAGTPTKGKAITAEIPTSLVTDLAKKAEVKWIEKHGRLKLLNDQAVLPQVMNVTPVWNTHGLTGEGQIIASLDSGIDTGSTTDINADFKDKIVDIIQMSDGDYKDYTGHGTHTAGSLVGTGANSSGQFKGVAYGAKLCVLSASGSNHKFSPKYTEGNEEILFNTGYSKWQYGVKSDSWGWEGTYGYDEGYDELCYACDDVIWNNPELLEILAAGNDGGGYEPDGSIDSPASAKNCLAVGSTGNRRPKAKDVKTDDEIAHTSSYSSLGPTYDGRIKPDICAPGEYVVSVLSANAASGSKFAANPKYQYMSGTSMATPLTAGCAALVREWLMKHRGYSETKPTAALMKAVLTGGATDIYNKDDIWSHIEKPVPSNFQGWGRVDLEASIFPTNGLAVYLKDRLPFEAGEEFAFTVVTTNAASLRAQLVWIDHAAEQEAGSMINNNLDLTVSNADIGTLYGNGGTAADELNTVESVRIENAAAGRYIVKVTCPTILYDYTEGGAAAIYIRGAFDPADIIEGEVTEAQIAAKKSPSKPVLLVDAGVTTKPSTVDAWQIVNIASDLKSYSSANGDVSVTGTTGARFFTDGTTKEFATGTFTDIYGATWSSVKEEMLVSLGLRGTKETDLNTFFKTSMHVEAGSGTTMTITGLNASKYYVLHYMTCNQNGGNKTGSFKLKSGGYAGTPTVAYVKGAATSYAAGTVGTAITASANTLLLVRVTNLRPNSEGKVVIDVGGATVNVLAIAEMPTPSVLYITRHP